MDTQLIFNVYNTSILFPWLAMLVFPTSDFTLNMVRSKWPVTFIAISYLVLFVVDASIGQGSGIDFTSFESIKSAFARDEMLLIGWLHYLAFDLLVGFYEFDHAQTNGIKRYLLFPCLLLTLMLGPVGWLVYTLMAKLSRGSNKKKKKKGT